MRIIIPTDTQTTYTPTPIYMRSILPIEVCPHCMIKRPLLERVHRIKTSDHYENNYYIWSWYRCSSCGCLTTARSERLISNDPDDIDDIEKQHLKVDKIYPSIVEISNDIPDPARQYLQEAKNAINDSPSGSIVISASAVDAMLKINGFVDGNLYQRIHSAGDAHLLTQTMVDWAHEVRMDANGQRHADEGVGLPSNEDAEKTFNFALMFAEYLFVMDARIRRER